jgi:L-serine dehydratase
MSNSFLFKNAAELLALCEKHNMRISDIAVKYEMEISEKTEEQVWEKMKKVASVMKEAIKNGIENPKKSISAMSGGDAQKIAKYAGVLYGDELSIKAMTYAIATGETNACMGRIAAFPTAGGAGVIPGVIMSISEVRNLPEEKTLRGLLAASAIGVVIAENATLSAAAAGCQAEVGAANACAAAAATEMSDGTPQQALTASAIALKSSLGLACDPLGGLVEVPCIKRNALGSQHALGAANLALAGVESFIPFDEVVEAMYEIGKLMSPRIRETALGGLAMTKTGIALKRKLGLPVIQ